MYDGKFCFIYGNSGKYPAYTQLLAIFGFESVMMCVIPIYVTYFYYIYLLKTRYGVTDQVYSRTFLYALAFHIHVPSTVYVPLKMWEKLVMFNFALMVFWINCYVQSAMAREFTVPKYGATDHPINDVRTVKELEELNYGIGFGQLCLHDILNGRYKQRVCLLDCLHADHYEAIYSFGDPIDFKNIIKISNDCLFKDKIERITRRYIEAGLFEKWFSDMNSLSHKLVS